MKKLHELTLTETIRELKNKSFSHEELVKDIVNRIEKFNSTLNVYITVNKNVVEDAKKIDAITHQKDLPLLGIPLAIKDNFLTKGLRTTASSKVLDDFIPSYESTVTKRLIEAGALILGKTNMDAWAHGSSTETSDYKATRNPWDINRLPGGSSGGSAASVSADLCIAAIGSETAGSIRQPASWCGVTGLKPSYGRVSRYGVVAMASSTDSPGPLTKTVEDSVLLLGVIAGNDPNDGTSMHDSWIFRKQTTKPTIGIVKDYFLENAEKGVNEKVLEAIEVLKKEGYKVKEVALLDPKYAIADYTVLQRAEVSSNLARYDGIRYGNDRTYFAQEAKRRIMLGTYVLSAGYNDQYYKKAQKVRTKIINDFENVFTQVDVLIAPTSPSTALPIGATKGASMFGELQDVLVEASSMAGLPGISIPCGFVNNLPVGMQIMGKLKNENNVLQVGLDFQQLTDWHLKKPQL
jgi:aspartyl-tRNA(Asn)/glutamyl-tRNA(Gln) amidotransferase subunit A